MSKKKSPLRRAGNGGPQGVGDAQGKPPVLQAPLRRLVDGGRSLFGERFGTGIF